MRFQKGAAGNPGARDYDVKAGAGDSNFFLLTSHSANILGNSNR